MDDERDSFIEINGNRMDVFTSYLPEFQVREGVYGMRVNVREFDEGLDYYKDQGYKVIIGPGTSISNQLAILEDDEERRVLLPTGLRMGMQIVMEELVNSSYISSS